MVGVGTCRPALRDSLQSLRRHRKQAGVGGGPEGPVRQGLFSGHRDFPRTHARLLCAAGPGPSAGRSLLGPSWFLPQQDPDRAWVTVPVPEITQTPTPGFEHGIEGRGG